MSRRRGLTPEERELWARVAKTAIPLNPAARRNDAGVLGSAPGAAAPPPAEIRNTADFHLPRSGLGIGTTAAQGRHRHDLAPSPAEALSRQPLRMDHKTHKQMTRGKMRPESRIDLHGMTLAQAGPALTGFILSCHARGLRLVLVITGKGSRAADEGPLPTRPGALRHQVPHWLHRPPLASVVQQVSSAHIRHGGAGAYYVYLRR